MLIGLRREENGEKKKSVLKNLHENRLGESEGVFGGEIPRAAQ